MKPVREEKGIALVTALMLTLISLTITMAMLYMITQNQRVSGAQKAYRNSLDASLGGVEIMTKDALPYLLTAADALIAPPANGFYQSRLLEGMPGLGSASLSIADDACLHAKLTKRPSEWGAYCATASTDLDATKSPDLSFVLKSAIPGAVSANGFKVSAKIVSTTIGTSDLSGRSYNTNSTTSAPGSDVGSPYIYRLEVAGERESNPKERAALTVLYAY